MKKLIRPRCEFVTASTYNKHRYIFAAEDNEFDDVDDVQLSGDLEQDFQSIVEVLRQTAYEDLGDALNDIVDDPKLYELLASGFGDGELAKVKMSNSPIALSVQQLLPSQSEIGLDNSLSYPLGQDCTNLFDNVVTIVAPILTYRKTFIIDGHHRWSQLYMMNPNAKIAAINFNYSDASPYRALRNFLGAVAVAQRDVPKQYAKVNNVYDMSTDAIEKYIDSNITDACWNSLVEVGVCTDRDSAIDYILDNIQTLKYDNPPFANAPEREFMPQTDDETVDLAEKGQTNI